MSQSGVDLPDLSVGSCFLMSAVILLVVGAICGFAMKGCVDEKGVLDVQFRKVEKRGAE